MLKKLIKYGNSNALVLDRTLLALLDIEEGSVLKLRVEGDQLIIKAAKEAKPTDSLMLEVENIHTRNGEVNSLNKPIIEMNEERIRSYCKNAEKDPQTMKELKDWLPGSKNAKKLEEAYGKILPKYQEEIKALGSEKFLKDIEKLTKNYKGDTSSEAYFNEFLKLRLKAAPKLAKMDKEMKDATEALGCSVGIPGLFKAPDECSSK